MKKQLIIIGVTLTLLSVGLSGCTEQKGTTNSNSNLLNGNQTNTPKTPENPDPFFPTNNSTQEYTYTPEGASTGISVEIEVKNGGKAGEVFVSVACAKKEWYASKVFYMDENENVTVKAHFNATISPYTYQSYKWDWTARVALPNDTSQGDIYIREAPPDIEDIVLNYEDTEFITWFNESLTYISDCPTEIYAEMNKTNADWSLIKYYSSIWQLEIIYYLDEIKKNYSHLSPIYSNIKDEYGQYLSDSWNWSSCFLNLSICMTSNPINNSCAAFYLNYISYWMKKSFAHLEQIVYLEKQLPWWHSTRFMSHFYGTWECVTETNLTMRYNFYENDTVLLILSFMNPFYNSIINNYYWFNYNITIDKICLEYIETKITKCILYSSSEEYTILTLESLTEPGHFDVFRRIS